MNLDMNTISMLMQLLSKKPDESNAQNASGAHNTHVHPQDDTSIEKSAFVAQNGIGEQISLDFQKPKETNDVKSDLFKNLINQNPALSILSGMQNGKADMSTMLPLLMSIMQKPKQSDDKCAASAQSVKDDAKEIDKEENACQNPANERQKEKTQRELFSPVAFSGYEVISSLYALLKASRRPCR